MKKFNKHKILIDISCIFFLFLMSPFIVKAGVNELDFSRTICINFNGGSSGQLQYWTSVDRAGEGFAKGDWLRNSLGVGQTVLDAEETAHTINGFSDNESPREGSFYQHVDCVGVTPYIRIPTPSKNGCTFNGWDTNISYDSYYESGGYWFFEVGCYAAGSGDININATWKTKYTMYIRNESHVNRTSGAGEHDENTWIQIQPDFELGYVLDYVEDLDNGKKYYAGDGPYDWYMHSDRHIRVVAKPSSYSLNITNGKHVKYTTGNGLYSPGTIAYITPVFDTGYILDYTQDMDNGIKYYINNDPYSWTMNKNRSVRVLAKPITYYVRYNNGNNDSTYSSTHQYDISRTLSSSTFRREYNITFDPNGGRGSITSRSANAVFQGWSASYNGTKLFNNRESVLNLTAEDNKIIDLYALWGAAEVKLPSPARAGYECTGWFTLPEGGEKVGNCGEMYTVDRSRTVYAQWRDILPPVIKVEGSKNVNGTETVEGIDAVQLKITAYDSGSGMKELLLYDLEGNEVARDIDAITHYVTKNGLTGFEIVARDHAGNESRKFVDVNVLTLRAEIENLNDGGSSVFVRGDRGVLRIQTSGFVERLQIEFARVLREGETDPNAVVELEPPRNTDEYEHNFVVPLYDVPDGEYTVTVKAYKGSRKLTCYPELTVKGSVLDKFKTEIKTYPKTKWK